VKLVTYSLNKKSVWNNKYEDDEDSIDDRDELIPMAHLILITM